MKKPDINKLTAELAARLEKLRAVDKESERIRTRIAEVRAKFQEKEKEKDKKIKG